MNNIEELNKEKDMLLKERRRIIMSITEFHYNLRRSVKEIDTGRMYAEAISLPIYKIDEKLRVIQDNINKYYDVEPVGIEKEFFYKKNRNEIISTNGFSIS